MVKKAQPLGVMAAYNKLNGTHCSENKELLTDILRKRWGYEGMVVTDWGAVKDRAKGIAAGQDLEMPGGSGRGTNSILSAIKAGTLSEEELNAAVRNLLRFVDSVTKTENASAVFDRDADYRMAVSVAENSAVLLKNEKGVLPLAKGCKAVFLGEFAEHPRYRAAAAAMSTVRRSAVRWNTPPVWPMHRATAPMRIPWILRWNRPRWPLP